MLLAVFAGVAGVYSLVLPLGEAADEAEHFALIRFIAENGRPPLSLAEQQRISVKGDASPFYHGLVALLTQHVDVSALPDLPDPRHLPERAIPNDRLPFKGLYHTENESFPLKGIVLAWHLARLVSIPLGLATLVALYLTVRAILPGRPWLVLTAAVLAAFIPRFVINSAIVSDDNLVLPLIGFSLYLLVKIIRGDQRDRTFFILGLLAGAAAIAKYHSLLLLPEITLVLAVLAWQQGGSRAAWLRRWGLSLLGFGLAAGWWFAFLFINFNRSGGAGWLSSLLAPLGDPVLSEGVDRALSSGQSISLGYETPLGGLEWAGLLFNTFWFRYGRGHVITVPVVNWSLALLALVAGLGLAKIAWKNRSWILSGSTRSWPVYGLLALHLLLYLALVATRYWLLPTRETAQGRHLYPALVSIALFLVLGLSQVWSTLYGAIRHRLAPAGNWPGQDRLLLAGLGSGFVLFSLLTLPFFIIPVYYPYLPIRTLEPADARLDFRLEKELARGVNFAGYSLPQPEAKAGQTLPLSLYWYASAGQSRDYLVRLCLHDDAGRPVTCHLSHPANGRYPMRAWEQGYLVRDDLALLLPACLPAGTYTLALSILPLRLDTAAAVPDSSRQTLEPLNLGHISLAGAAQPLSPGAFSLVSAGEVYSSGSLTLRQLRQALTLVTYAPAGAPAGEASLQPDIPGARPWAPVASEVVYPCPDGLATTAHHFLLDPAVAPGDYSLNTGAGTAETLTVNVQTRPRNFDLPDDPDLNLYARFADQVELLGYRLDTAPRQAGDTVKIEVYWRALRYMPHRYVASIHLLDPAVTMWGQIDHVLGEDFEYPNVLWAPGEIVRQVFHLPIAPQAPPGLYGIEFGVYDYIDGNFNFLPVEEIKGQKAAGQKQLLLDRVRVLDPAQTIVPSHPLRVTLDDRLQLLGYDLTTGQSGGQTTLDLALHWQALTPLSADYTVFTQLIGPDGRVWSQQDNQPQAGRYPTTAWAVNDKVVDRYTLVLTEDAPPGQYRLLAGMYELATGQRLPAIDEAGQALADSAIVITTLDIPRK